ncbi:MAG: glycosyltransferase [bacterium]|nr:glycosyltransferase [bacterium]
MNMNNNLNTLQAKLNKTKISSWNDISLFLDSLKSEKHKKQIYKNLYNVLSNGIAFITFDYGIDGVSIEIQKYAQSLELLFKKETSRQVPLHFIGGDFYDKADTVLSPKWNRFQIPDMNGWSKWSNGKWFSKLFYEDMPEKSKVSNQMAHEIWNQSINFIGQLGKYIIDNNIKLLIPVNICTNPGNPAITLAVTILTEAFDMFVISSNHDYYWEGGKADRSKNENPGPRDHFFKNHNNKEFFNLLKKLYPWNGKRWLQVNINEPQSEALIEKFGFSKNHVFELSSCISDKFLNKYKKKEVISARERMAYILSDGSPVIHPTEISSHLENLHYWMKNQKPIVCGNRENQILDPREKGTIYCLQPTRIIGRKRIYKDLKILTALLNHEKLNNAFKEGKIKQLILHITGPVPIEHQKDLEKVLYAYKNLCINVDDEIADRIFIAFSVGTENHPSLKKNRLEKLCIEDIYKLADIILFPSETEGRGLPIIESSACGIPIVCSRYYPEEVFDAVIGTELKKNRRIKYILFPEDDNYKTKLLDKISEILLNKEYRKIYSKHNRQAVKKRFGIKMLVNKFDDFIKILQKQSI